MNLGPTWKTPEQMTMHELFQFHHQYLHQRTHCRFSHREGDFYVWTLDPPLAGRRHVRINRHRFWDYRPS
jgi:hypothetical protein